PVQGEDGSNVDLSVLLACFVQSGWSTPMDSSSLQRLWRRCTEGWRWNGCTGDGALQSEAGDVPFFLPHTTWFRGMCHLLVVNRLRFVWKEIPLTHLSLLVPRVIKRDFFMYTVPSCKHSQISINIKLCVCISGKSRGS
ncbi:unnamed protein product, partial [Ectocarpus sp. 4 AP-2014]